MADALTILHLSDTPFGRNHLFGSLQLSTRDDRLDTLGNRLVRDLAELRNEHGLAPDLVLITGDHAEWRRQSELDEFRAFLELLVAHLEIPRGRVVLIPGNHDINRKRCEAYFSLWGRHLACRRGEALAAATGWKPAPRRRCVHRMGQRRNRRAH